MRIFYAANSTPNNLFHSNIWRDNLYRSLVDMGHEVVEFRYDLTKTLRYADKTLPLHSRFILKNRPRVSGELLSQVMHAHSIRPLDLFFSYFCDACILPDTVDAIRSLGITTVNWYCNGSYQLHLVSEISPHYDWCLVPERFRLKDYEGLGARPIYCQEAGNQDMYRPYPLPKEYDVTFVGQAYGNRPAYIQSLNQAGVDVRVWGYGWDNYTEGRTSKSIVHLLRKGSEVVREKDWRMTAEKMKRRLSGSVAEADAHPLPAPLPRSSMGGVLTDGEMVRMFSRSKINLGFSACMQGDGSGKNILQVRLRDFEVPMSGGFYMVEYMEELEEFFAIGEEIVCYTSPDDLVDKVRYYLAHEEERERIREAGRERCLRDHTWRKRFENSFRVMGLDGR